MRFMVDFVETLERKTRMVIEVADANELKEKGVQSALESIVAEWPKDYWETDSVWGVCIDAVNKINPKYAGEAVHYLIREADGSIRVTEDELEYDEAMGLDEETKEAPPPLPGQLGLGGIGEDVPGKLED